MHCHFPRFLLEKIRDAYLLTTSCCTTPTVMVSHCAATNKKALMPPVGPTERKSPVVNNKAPLQIEIQRHVIRTIKKNKYSPQLSVKVAFGEDVDGDSDQKLLLLGSRVNEGSINRSSQNYITEHFSKKETTKQAKFLYLQEVGKTGENGNQHVQNVNNMKYTFCLMWKTNLNYFLLLLQIKPVTERQLDLNPAVKQEPVNIMLKETNSPPPTIKTIRDFITLDTSKCKRFKGRKDLLKFTVTDRTKIVKLQPAEKTENRETDVDRTNENTPNPDEDLVLPSPPSVKATQAQTTTEVYSTGAANTTNTEAFSRDNPHGQPQRDQNQAATADPEPETKTETRLIKVTPEAFSGLRMREDVHDVLTKLHKDTEHHIRASTNWVRTEQKDRNRPQLKLPLTHSGAFGKETTNYRSKVGLPEYPELVKVLFY